MRCNTEKPLSDFHERRDSAVRAETHFTVCKRCKVDAAMERHWQSRYGLGSAEVDRLFAEQGGHCAICGDAIFQRRGPGHALSAHLDHRHSDGKVRKFLCRNCNLGLGYFKDNTARMSAAIEYLKEHE